MKANPSETGESYIWCKMILLEDSQWCFYLYGTRFMEESFIMGSENNSHACEREKDLSLLYHYLVPA